MFKQSENNAIPLTAHSNIENEPVCRPVFRPIKKYVILILKGWEII